MNYGKARKEIREGNIAPLYVLFGGDGYLQSQLVADLKDKLVAPDMVDFCYQSVDGGQLGEIIQFCRTPGFFGGKRLVVVNDHPLFAGGEGDGEEALMEYGNSPSTDACLVFRMGKAPDRRRKIVKALSDYMVDCQSLKGHELEKWLGGVFRERKHPVEPAALRALLSLVGDSMPLLEREAEKVITYAGGRKVTPADVAAVAVGIPQETVFRLLDSVCTGQGGQALKILRQLREKGEAVPMILFMLARQVRLIRLCREMAGEGMSPAQMAKELGQHPFVMKKCTAQARAFTRDQLVKGMELVLHADHSIKSGQRDEDLAIQQLVVALTQLPASP